MNTSLYFNGSSGYGQIADGAGNRLETTNQFSCSFWMYPESHSHNVLPRIWEKLSNYACIMGDTTNGKYGKVAIEVANTAATVVEYWGDTFIVPNNWYHVAISFNGNSTKTIAAAGIPGVSRSGNVVTVTTTAAHEMEVGEVVTIAGVTDATFNGSFTILTCPTTTTFTYAQTAGNATSGGGTAEVMEARMWVNGHKETIDEIFDNEWTGTMQSTVGSDLFIGRRRTDQARNFKGNITDLKFWDRPLYTSEIGPMLNDKIYPRNGLLMEYRMDDLGGDTVLIDSSGNGINGAISGVQYSNKHPFMSRNK